MNLKELEIGKSAIVTKVGGDGALRQHFLDMGIIPGVEVVIVKYAPRGDPMEVRIHGYELTLRLADARKIEVVPAGAYEKQAEDDGNSRILTPGREKEETKKKALPDDVQLTFCPDGKPELRQDDAVQSAHRIQTACRKLPGRYGGGERRWDHRLSECCYHGSSGHIFDVALYQ